MERVLVCLLASTRAHQLTFPSFKRHVLDELNADLALALAIDESYDYANRYWQHAKYRWTAPDFRDVGKLFDLAQRSLCHQYNVSAPDWRPMLQIKGIWQGGIRSSEPERTYSSIQMFCRWLLLNGLQQDDILDRYDRFIITRSDFVWLNSTPTTIHPRSRCNLATRWRGLQWLKRSTSRRISDRCGELPERDRRHVTASDRAS